MNTCHTGRDSGDNRGHRAFENPPPPEQRRWAGPVPRVARELARQLAPEEDDRPEGGDH